MSKGDKPFTYTRQILSDRFIELVGEAFGKRILEEKVKNDDVLKLMNAMFSEIAVDNTPAHIQEIHLALKILENYKPTKALRLDKEALKDSSDALGLKNNKTTNN